LLEISGAGRSMLDSRSQIAQIAAWWSACGTSHLLPGFASRLAGLPPTATDQTVTRGLRLALAAERYSPWRLWIESARTKRGQALPSARRTVDAGLAVLARRCRLRAARQRDAAFVVGGRVLRSPPLLGPHRDIRGGPTAP